MTDHADLRRLAASATPGPRSAQAAMRLSVNALIYGSDGDSFARDAHNPGNDYDPVATAAYIAAASPDVILGLLDEIERLRTAIDVRYMPEAEVATLVRDMLADLRVDDETMSRARETFAAKEDRF